jgi:hypothetical protein
MPNLRGAFLLMVLLIGGIPCVGAEESAQTDSTATGEQGSWIASNLERYFGNNSQQVENLDGESLEVVSKYLQYEGMPIEVVLVHQVPSFAEGWDRDRSTTDRLVTGMTSGFQSYTRDSVIRQYLLFEQGDKVDPFAFVDSEVMLRKLSYINDVRILIIPLKGEIESVAVVVETTDRWPFGVNGTIVTAEKYWVEVYSENIAGTGLKFTNRFLHKTTADPSWGYRGLLRKENIKGTFLAGELLVENSYERKTKKIQVDRQLSHQGLHRVGGISFERTTDFPSKNQVRTQDFFDAWLGEVIRLYDPREVARKERPILVPAIRMYDQKFLDRPTVSPDTNRSYHDRVDFLFGLTFQSVKSYKTSYLFGVGETEDLPIGKMVRFTTGYESREFEKRTPLFIEGAFLSIRHRGDLFTANLDLGGFLRNSRMEDGMLNLSTGYVTPLLGEGSTRWRLFSQLRYTLGLNRHPGESIELGGNNNVRELSRSAVKGNQRLAGGLEASIFTPWSLWGFRFNFFGFTDVGMTGSEKASSIFTQKIYVSTGLGLRLRNPSLVLPTVEVQLSFLTNVESPGMSFGIKVGNSSTRKVRVPGTKPALPSYN